MGFIEADFVSSIGKIIVFLMILFSVFLLTVKSKKKLSNVIFAFFLLVTAFDLLGLFIGQEIANVHFLQSLKTASSLLQMPLFYFYVLSVCYSDFNFKWKDALHTIPFVAFLLVFLSELIPNRASTIFQVAGEIQYLAYIIAIFVTLKKHKTVFLENFSNPDYTAYIWLFQATLLFCFAHVFVVIRWILNLCGSNPEWLQAVNIVITISALLVTCWLVLKAMYKPQLFLGVETQLEPIAPIQKPKNPAFNEEAVKIQSMMETHKPFLDYELSLEKLASQFKMEPKELSILINQHMGKHFFDFINEYRIAEAKSVLGNPEMAKMSVLEILYQVGFNSKSSFYTAFKKEVGMTPTEYRKSVS